MRTVLLIAFHFPPIRGSSGVQRTLRFAQHLPKFGWRPIVLTVNPFAYEAAAEAEGNEIPAGLMVERAFGLDAARHLSFRGRYPRRFATPDRWTSWKTWAIGRATKLIRREKIAAVWSTFPIATAHEIGFAVATGVRLPWIAEFRDPMWQGDYPPDPTINRSWKEIEARVFKHADGVVVTTPSAVEIYSDRFPGFPRSNLVKIENGYDEETFLRASVASANDGMPGGKPVTLLHSGVVYPSERDPTHLFQAISNLKQRGLVDGGRLRIVFRASGHDERYQKTVESLAIDDVVKFEPGIDYLSALKEMVSADGLLLLQAANCNAQIPAKLYEYLRAGRPILALTDPAGDTARTLDHAGAGLIAPLDSVAAIEHAVSLFLEQVTLGTWRRSPIDVVRRYSRESQAQQLADLLDRLVLQEPRAQSTATAGGLAT